MSIQFDWQTDSEDQNAMPPLPEVRPMSRRMRRFLWGIVGLLVIVVSVGGFWLVRESRTRSAVFTQEVQTSHQLVLETAAAGDADLFAALLSPFHDRWPETGRELLTQNLLLDRAAFSLWADSGWQDVPSVIEFSPDMQTAVLTTDIPYIAEKTDGVTETVTLRQTAVYERDGSQWWLAPLPPADDGFWGRRRTVQGDVLHIEYRERDAAVVHDLFFDLEELLDEFCRFPEANCPAVFQLTLRMEAEPAALLNNGADYRQVSVTRTGANELNLRLPTPTLAGLPVDEAGYAALVRGYGSWMTAVLLVEFNRVQTPRRQLVAGILAQLDLPTPSQQQIRPWQLANSPPIPFPEQDLLMICNNSSINDPPEFWRYQMTTNNWTNENELFREWFFPPFNPSNEIAMTPLPDDSGAWLISTSFGVQTTEFYQWRDNQADFLAQTDGVYNILPPYFLLPPMWQDGRLLLLKQGVESLSETAWLDMENCPGEACSLGYADRIPLWSPDGRHTLLNTFGEEAPRLWLGDDVGQTQAELWPGLSPFWLDADTFAAIRLVEKDTPGEFGSEVVTAVLNESGVTEPKTLFTSQDLQVTVGVNEELATLTIMPMPGNADTWVLMAVEQPLSSAPGQGFVLTYQPAADELAYLEALDFGFAWLSLEMAGNGRYLTTISPQNSATFRYLLFDLETDKTLSYEYVVNNTFSPIDGSADGNWFVLPDEEGWLWLTAPAHIYQRPLFHGVDGCNTAVFVNR